MFLNNTPLYIGTSGYNHEDWKGNFAPEDIHNYDMLSYYADNGFNFLELTFTFYRIPELDKIRHILLRTKNRIKFSIRVPKLLIHNPSDSKVLSEFLKGVSPIIDAGLLECFFADYHVSYVLSKKTEELVLKLRRCFEGFRFFAEMHNKTWYKERIFNIFRDNDLGFTVIDMPEIRGLAPYYPISLNFAQYVKLYGHSKKWILGQDKNLEYSYDDKMLKKIITDAVSKSVTSTAVYIVFANVANGYAPKNAQRLKDIVLGL